MNCHDLLMKLTTWAKQQGISYTTAWRWWKAGKLPVASGQVASGTITVHMHSNAQGLAARPGFQ